MMEEFNLERVARGEITVTPFTRHRTVHLAVPESAGLAETGPSGDDREAAVGLRRTLVEDGEVLRPKHSDPVGIGLEIVNQQHALEAQTARELARIHHPGQVRRHGAPVLDRPGNAETRALDLDAVLCYKLRNDFFQAGMLLAGIVLLPSGGQAFALHLEPCQPGVGAPDVARQNHESISLQWFPSRSSRSCASLGPQAPAA